MSLSVVKRGRRGGVDSRVVVFCCVSAFSYISSHVLFPSSPMSLGYEENNRSLRRLVGLVDMEGDELFVHHRGVRLRPLA